MHWNWKIPKLRHLESWTFLGHTRSEPITGLFLEGGGERCTILGFHCGRDRIAPSISLSPALALPLTANKTQCLHPSIFDMFFWIFTIFYLRTFIGQYRLIQEIIVKNCGRCLRYKREQGWNEIAKKTSAILHEEIGKVFVCYQKSLQNLAWGML